MTTAFEGLRVLDFSEGIPGPMACMHLADFGAEVIKIERPGGDRMKDHPGYLCWNRNKQVMTLDLQRYDGLATAKSLLQTADAAVFDWAPGHLEQLGLDAVSLHGGNPALLHAWLPPFAARGRWATLPPDDGLVAAVGMASYSQMSYEDRPVHLVTPQVSYGHGMLAAGALAAGLFERGRSGQGQALVVSGLHAIAALQAAGTMEASNIPTFPRAASSRGGTPNYRLYKCKDGLWLFLGSLTPQFFIRALDALDLMDLYVGEGIEGDYARMMQPGNRERVGDALDERFMEKTRDEWMQILHDADVPRGPVGISEEWFAGETVTANEMRLSFEHPRLGRVELPGAPVKLSDTPAQVRSLPARVAASDLPAHTPLVEPGEARGGGPLAGVRVLDLGAFIAGTYAPAILSQWGAEVIKIEPPDGDPFRLGILGFMGYNRGKRSVILDLKQPAGREAFLDLVRDADIVLDNYRVGVRERLGIDYATLRAINPRIISCSVTGYGPRGPLSADPGFDPLLQARSGLMHAQGSDEEPVFYSIPINDDASALMAAFGMLAALNARERTGEGQDVQTCLANQSILCQSGELTWYEGRPSNPPGGRDCLGVSPLQRLYKCADGWLALACSAPEHFAQACLALGHPEWAARTTAEAASRESVDGTLAALIADALVAMPRDEAVQRLLIRNVPAAPAVNKEEFMSSAWVAENDYFGAEDHPQAGHVRAQRTLSEWSRSDSGYPRRSPVLGEHTVEVLREWGFGEARIQELLASGVAIQGEEAAPVLAREPLTGR
ncbi:MAG TPA: CoA transferase [Tepidiformaceae bacterium]|nr:CoA transferase [Tepidiformaceae bacterium]